MSAVVILAEHWDEFKKYDVASGDLVEWSDEDPTTNFAPAGPNLAQVPYELRLYTLLHVSGWSHHHVLALKAMSSSFGMDSTLMHRCQDFNEAQDLIQRDFAASFLHFLC